MLGEDVRNFLRHGGATVQFWIIGITTARHANDHLQQAFALLGPQLFALVVASSVESSALSEFDPSKDATRSSGASIVWFFSSAI
jgi:hypothetical protein